MATATIHCNTEALNAEMTLYRWTNQQLALHAGVSKATVGLLRSGHRTTTSPATAAAIEKALRVNAGDVFRREP